MSWPIRARPIGYVPGRVVRRVEAEGKAKGLGDPAVLWYLEAYKASGFSPMVRAKGEGLRTGTTRLGSRRGRLVPVRKLGSLHKVTESSLTRSCT